MSDDENSLRIDDELGDYLIASESESGTGFYFLEIADGSDDSSVADLKLTRENARRLGRWLLEMTE